MPSLIIIIGITFQIDHSLSLRCFVDEIIDENPTSDFLTDPSEEMLSFLKTDVTCALLWIHYLLDVLPSKRRVSDLPGIMRYMKALPRLKYKVRSSERNSFVAV